MKILMTCVLFTLLLGCNTTKHTPETYQSPQLMFGSGGGFSGIEMTYSLFENGQMFVQKGVQAAQEAMGKVETNTCKQLFSNYDVLKLADYNFDQPGNAYYFVGFKNGNDIHKITWGAGNQDVSNNVKIFYQLLNRLVKTKK